MVTLVSSWSWGRALVSHLSICSLPAEAAIETGVAKTCDSRGLRGCAGLAVLRTALPLALAWLFRKGDLPLSGAADTVATSWHKERTVSSLGVRREARLVLLMDSARSQFGRRGTDEVGCGQSVSAVWPSTGTSSSGVPDSCRRAISSASCRALSSSWVGCRWKPPL